MEKNYFIKNGYIPNKIISSTNIKKWEGLKLSSKSFYNQYYVYVIGKKLIKKLNLSSVLDIGCREANKLMNLIYPVCNNVYGIDFEDYFIEQCKRKYKTDNFFVDDVENPKLELNKKFDLIICSDIIEHLIDPDKLLHYIRKYSHENSVIIISTPERDLRYGKQCNKPKLKGHIREWNFLEFKNYIEYQGFEILYHKPTFNVKIRININRSIKTTLKNQIFLIKTLLLKKKRTKAKSLQIVVCRLK